MPIFQSKFTFKAKVLQKMCFFLNQIFLGKISEPYEKDFVYKPQVRIEAPESIQGPMKQLSVNQDGPPQTGRTQVVRADAPMREKRGSDASRPTPYDRGSVDRRQGKCTSNCENIEVKLP